MLPREDTAISLSKLSREKVDVAVAVVVLVDCLLVKPCRPDDDS